MPGYGRDRGRNDRDREYDDRGDYNRDRSRSQHHGRRSHGAGDYGLIKIDVY